MAFQLTNQIFLELIYALGIGVLIGLERSTLIVAEDSDAIQAGNADKRSGLRTFSLFSLTGYCGALLSDMYPFVAPLVLVSLALLIIVAYNRSGDLGLGITTEVAAIATCGLGMLCHTHMQVAGVLGLVVTALLSAKRFTHNIVARMRRVEVTDTLKFMAIILIILPLMPNRTLDPYGAFNPYKVTFLVILISGIGYVGYFLTRILGARRGLGLTGLIGGLTSSTAVTVAMAAQAKANDTLKWICAFSTVGANATMFMRVLVVVAILNRALAVVLVWSIGTMGAVALVASIILWFVAAKSADRSKASNEVPFKNPFSLGPAVKFAGFFVLILVVARLAKIYLGDQGVYLASAASGLADVDAITLSLTEQSKEGSVALNVAAIGITIAVVANSIVKSTISIYSGGWSYGWIVTLVLLLATGAGLFVSLLV